MPSNIAASWIADLTIGPNEKKGSSENLIGGVLQGRKQYDPRGASRVCKRRMWKLALEVAGLAAVPAVETCLRVGKYGVVKQSGLLSERRRVKSEVRDGALKGWVRNEGGEGFGFDGLEF